jgi:eukaryotic-like serine/threonine-protein kinase
MTDSIDRMAEALADRYHIERELGAGGMATVYLAQDVKHDRKVAIKVLRPELAAVLGADRFVQEIKTTAALQHPHILPLFDSGSAGGFLYYVMPYVQGETLRNKLDREHQLGVDEAVKITTDVADALDYAHRQGVIHRDIKPENILLHDGRPMVADFGIALAVSAAAGGRMTETGLSLGTPHYMSPEQATAEKEITGRSDIYSLASVLYEMLTGQPPHLGGSAQQIIMKIIAEPVAAVTTHRKNVPANVAAAVAQALEKLPADRFDSARAFADALANPSFTLATAAGPAATGRLGSQRRLIYGVAGVAAVAIVAALWGWLRPRPDAPVISYGLALPERQGPISGGSAPAAAPDGSYLVYVGSTADGRGTQLWMKRRDSHLPTPLAGTAGAVSFAIAPDSRSVAFVAGGDLRIVSLAGGAAVTVVGDSAVPGLGIAWLEDGMIAYVSLGRILSLRLVPAGGGPSQIVSTQDSLGLPAAPAPVPGTSSLLFLKCTSNAQCALWARPAGGDTARLVAPDAVAAQVLPGGYLLYRVGGSLMAAPFDPRRLEITGAPVSLADSVAQFTLSPAGTLVEVLGAPTSDATYVMEWVDRTGRRTPVDSAWTFRLTAFANNAGWSLALDGSRIAIGVNGQEGDDIWVKPLPRGPASRVTFNPSPDYRPHWTRDGRWVVFLRSVPENGVYMRRADGTGGDSLLRAGGGGTGFQEAVLSPDGQWLLMRQGGNVGAGGRDILGVRLGRDTVPVPVVSTRYDEDAIALSPDGRWLAYQSDETGTVEVFIRPFPSTDAGKWQVSSGGGTAPLWSRDGHELFYLSSGNDMMSVRVGTGATLTPGQPTMLFHIPPDLLAVETTYYTPWDVAPDGRFLMARRVDQGPGAPAQTYVVVENFSAELKARLRR